MKYYHQFILAFNGDEIGQTCMIVFTSDTKTIKVSTFKQKLKSEFPEKKGIYTITSHVVFLNS